MLRYIYFYFVFSSSLLLSKENNFQLISSDFNNNETIPVKFTCTGKDISPKLLIKNIPLQTKSLVLIVDDPDAPAGIWVHWILYNIPINITKIKENQKKGVMKLKWGGLQGINSWGKFGYGGPCPPTGIHRYFFKLYAVNKKLKPVKKITKQQIMKMIKGHIIATTKLTGLYKKKR